MAKNLKINTILNTIKTLSSILFPLITIPYINRVLLPDNVGKVNWVNSYVGYFSLIAALGISTYSIRFLSQYKDDREKLSKTASEIFSINLITTFISYFFLIITLLLFRKLDTYRLLIIISSTTIFFSTIGADYINTAMEDFKYITIRTIAFQIVSLILMFLFVREQSDYYKYMMILVLSSSAANISNFFYRKKYCKFHFTLNIPWRTHMPPIILLFVMSLSQVIFNNVDITMLGVMWNEYEVGIYSTAHKIMNITAQVVQSVILVILPRLSTYFVNNDYDKINGLLKKVLVFNLGLGLPCVTGVLLLAKDIIFIVGGKEFEGAVPVLRILILCFMFSLVGGSFLGNAILIPSKKEKYYTIVCWITAVCNVILNFILIPRLASIGAAISTAFNGLLILILLLFKVDKRIKIEKKSEAIIAPLVGCLGIVVCCYICSFIPSIVIRVISSVAVSSVVYFSILYFMKNLFAIEILNMVCLKFRKSGGKYD